MRASDSMNVNIHREMDERLRREAFAVEATAAFVEALEGAGYESHVLAREEDGPRGHSVHSFGVPYQSSKEPHDGPIAWVLDAMSRTGVEKTCYVVALPHAVRDQPGFERVGLTMCIVTHKTPSGRL